MAHYLIIILWAGVPGMESITPVRKTHTPYKGSPMNHPRHQLLWMTLYLGIVAVVCLLMFAPLKMAFMANWGFNLLILAALVTGIAINMRQVFALEPELHWIKMFRTGNIGISVSDPTRLMKPLAKHLEGLNRDRFSLSAFSMRTVLDLSLIHI